MSRRLQHRWVALPALLAAVACGPPEWDGARVACETTAECVERFGEDFVCHPAGLCVRGERCRPDDPDCTSAVEIVSAVGRRPTPTPFAYGLAVPGDLRFPTEPVGDEVSFDRGRLIGGAFYQHMDAAQGTVVTWVVPQWSTQELGGSEAALFEVAGFTVAVAPGGDLAVSVPTRGVEVVPGAAAGWRAGEAHLIVLRWDSRRPLIATRHVVLSVDDEDHALFDGELPVTPTANQRLGARSGGRSAANAHLAGFTVYRRPLFGGGAGVDLGRGDELAALRDGRDPASVTGSWDVVFALPTWQGLGALDELGDAWTHPHAKNLLGAEGFFYGSAGPPVGWSMTGGPFATEPLVPATSIYGGGTLSAARGVAALTRDVSLIESTSWVLRAVAHGVSGGVPRVKVAVNGSPLSMAAGTGSGSPFAPVVLTFTGQAPAGTLTVRLENAADTGVVLWHQVELLENRIPNPSLERGSGSPWHPDGWLAEVNEEAVSVTQDTTERHTGDSSVRIVSDFSNVGGGGFAYLRGDPGDLEQGGYYAAGGFFFWHEGERAGISVINGALFPQNTVLDRERKFHAGALEDDTRWQHVTAVGRRWEDGGLNAHNDFVRWGCPRHMCNIDVHVDDAYLVPLSNVRLVGAAASVEASIVENVLRADGDDGLTQSADGLGARHGVVSFTYRLGPAVGSAPLLPAGRCALLSIWADGDNYFSVVQTPEGLRLEGVVQERPVERTFEGGLEPAGWHRMVVSYTRRRVEVEADDRSLGRVSLGRRLAAAPQTLTFGAMHDGPRECDLMLALPGAALYSRE